MRACIPRAAPLTLRPWGSSQVNEAAEIIYDLVDPNANLIFGAVVDPGMGDAVSITIIATGFGATEPEMTALKGHASISRVASSAASTVSSAAAAVSAASKLAAAGPKEFPKAKSPEVGGGAGGIEIPAFLRRRRLQGK